MISYFEGRT